MEGSVEVKVPTEAEEVRIQKATAGSTFGHRVLIGGNNGLTISSRVGLSRPSAVLVSISAEDFVSTGLDAHFRAIFERKREILRSCCVFAAISEEELEALAHFTQLTTAPRNTAIVEENAQPSFLCIITRGEF